MDQKRLMELGLDEATAKKIYDEIVVEKGEKDFVPIDRLNEEIEKKKRLETEKIELEKQVGVRDNQIGELKKSVPESLQKKIEELQAANDNEKAKREAAEKEYSETLRTMRRDAIDDELLNSTKARNKTVVKALFESVDDKFDETAYRAEREKQIKALVEGADTKFLFGSDAEPNQRGLRVFVPGNGGGDPGDQAGFGASYAAKLNAKNNPQK